MRVDDVAGNFAGAYRDVHFTPRRPPHRFQIGNGPNTPRVCHVDGGVLPQPRA